MLWPRARLARNRSDGVLGRPRVSHDCAGRHVAEEFSRRLHQSRNGIPLREHPQRAATAPPLQRPSDLRGDLLHQVFELLALPRIHLGEAQTAVGARCEEEAQRTGEADYPLTQADFPRPSRPLSIKLHRLRCGCMRHEKSRKVSEDGGEIPGIDIDGFDKGYPLRALPVVRREGGRQGVGWRCRNRSAAASERRAYGAR